MNDLGHETDAIKERYARRDDKGRYSLKRPEVRKMLDERRQAVQWLLKRRGWDDTSTRRIVEVGCGEGNILSELLQIGFSHEHMTGIDLLEESINAAQRKLPSAVKLIAGDARTAGIRPLSQDLVLQFTAFSSILDNNFQHELANIMWQWLKPSGAVLWYDFMLDNPYNSDVRGVPPKKIRELFPSAHITVQRITLAPPLARAVCWLHPSLYSTMNRIPILRTHALAWVEKPAF